jgi:hypothetical protein
MYTGPMFGIVLRPTRDRSRIYIPKMYSRSKFGLVVKSPDEDSGSVVDRGRM